MDSIEANKKYKQEKKEAKSKADKKKKLAKTRKSPSKKKKGATRKRKGGTKTRCDIRTLKKKIQENGWGSLYKYEQKYYWKNRRDKADYLAQLYAKLKAFEGKKRVKCLTCDMVGTIDQFNGCHWIEKKRSGTYWCRREERNIYCCCANCNNNNKQTHTRRLTEHVTQLYGQEQVSKRQAEDRKVHRKPKWYEIDEKIEHYKQKVKAMKQG